MDEYANIDKHGLLISCSKAKLPQRGFLSRIISVFTFFAFVFPSFPLVYYYSDLFSPKARGLDCSVSQTALWISSQRCLAHWLGILQEPLALKITPFTLKLYTFLFEFIPYLAFGQCLKLGRRKSKLGNVIARTILFDSVVRNSEFEQIVILGAGFDCRAHRFSNKNCQVFEVDTALTQKCKKLMVSNIGSTLPSSNGKITYVPCDFSKQNFLHEVQGQGFDEKIPTLFTLEGVVRYLTWENLSETLKLISSSCAKGSLVAMNLPIDKWSTPQLRKKFEQDQADFIQAGKWGENVKFGMNSEVDTPETKFLPLSYESVDVHLGPKEIQKRCFSSNFSFDVDSNFVVLRV